MPVVTRSGQRGGTPVALGLVSALVVATSLAAVVSRQWTPVNDQAILWLNANDVGTADTPLTGLYSRFGWDHPGPMAFYLLALPLRLFGGRPSALLVGAVLLGLVAIVLAVWSAYRAGSLGAAIPVALVVSVLVVALGDGLIDPWTPWLVVLPLVAFVCVLWAWLGGNRVMAPIAAGLGTFMVQTHVGLVVPVALIGVAALAWRVLDRSGSRPQWRRPPWVTFVVLTVLWIPPLAQQVFTRPGNLGDLLAHFSGASGEVTPGLAMGLRLAATSLSPVGPWVGRDAPGFLGGISPAPTWWLVFPVALLVVSVMLAWRWQDVVGLRLVGLVAAGQVATVVALTRVEGIPYPYLIWWSRGVVALTVAAPLVVLGRRIGARVGTEPSRLPIVGLVACIVTVFAVLAVFRESPLSGPSSRYRALVAGVPSVLPEATVVRVDSQGGGAFDYSPATLVIALKEQGLRALLAPVRSVSGAPLFFAGENYAARPDEVLPTFVITSGWAVDTLLSRPGARVVSAVDPLSPDERAEARELRGLLRDEAVRRQRPELVAAIDEPQRLVFAEGTDTGGLDPNRLARYLELTSGEQPLAVVELPPTDWPLP